MISKITDFHFTTPKQVKSGSPIDVIVSCLAQTQDFIDLQITGPGAPTVTPNSIALSGGFNSMTVPLTVTGGPGIYVVVANLRNGYSTQADEIETL